MPRILGYGAFSAVILAAYEYTGGTLKGYLDRPEMDEYERKELLRKNRRRPIEETIAEIGEGRGEFPNPATRRPPCFLLGDIN
jgi:putative N-acetylmannosamine-6-phosphate epimerase